jgi:GTP-binding protein
MASGKNGVPTYDKFVDIEVDLSQEEYDEDDDYGDYDDDDGVIDYSQVVVQTNADGTEIIVDPTEGGGSSKRSKNVWNDQEWMFFDVARINVKGGDGGNGCMAMRREFRLEFGGPCGGNGGNGGSVYLECDETLNTLAMLRRRVHHKGKPGKNGLGKSMHGEKGTDVLIPVPPGTIVRDQSGVLAGELNMHGQRMLVAKGGRGGRGNEHFRTPRNKAPAFAEKGAIGTGRWLNIELKLIADVGFVGVPNAGKSTLLASASNAKPKIADYPFTTIVPNLGVCDFTGFGDSSSSVPDGKGLVLADIPGLLEGAHDGKGLGLAFLRHVDRCRVLIHILDGDSKDPIGDFKVINQELELFNPNLKDRTQVVVINKIDIPDVKELLPEMVSDIKRISGHTRVMGISAATRENVPELMKRVRKLIDAMPSQSEFELFTEEEERVTFDDEEDDEFEILYDDQFPGQFRVAGAKIEKMIEQMNWDYYEAVQRFQRILDAQGVTEALKMAGAKQGDLIMIGDLDFNFWDKKNVWVEQMGMENINPRQRGENKNTER